MPGTLECVDWDVPTGTSGCHVTFPQNLWHKAGHRGIIRPRKFSCKNDDSGSLWLLTQGFIFLYYCFPSKKALPLKGSVSKLAVISSHPECPCSSTRVIWHPFKFRGYAPREKTDSSQHRSTHAFLDAFCDSRHWEGLSHQPIKCLLDTYCWVI